MVSRPLMRLPIPPGEPGVAVLKSGLAQALDGSGPAIAPIPVTSMTVSQTYVGALLAAVRPDDASAPLERDDVAIVLPTSGSTGDPKGVLLTAENARASVDLSLAAIGEAARTAHWLVAVPVTSAGGLKVVLTSLLTGTGSVTMPSVGGALPFTPEGFAASTRELVNLAGGDPIMTSLVPTQLIRLLEDPAGLDALREYAAVLIGGAALAESVRQTAMAAGVTVMATFGMTETAGGCVYEGKPFSGVDVAIDDGEIVIKGPVVAAGYRLRPDETRERFTDGWFRTRDTGSITDGTLTVHGRLDDIVQIKGINVSVGAVESCLRSNANVRDCAVVAVPHPENGMQLHAFAVLRSPVEERELKDLVRDRLGAAAVPATVHQIDELPVLPSGKIDRGALRGRIS